MKARFPKPVRFVCLLCLAVGTTPPELTAQTPLGLSIQMNAGQPQLTVAGAVDTSCQIQWTDNFSSTSRWYHLDHCVLSSPPGTLTDSTAAPATGRYYRAVWVPNTNMVWIPPGTFTMGSPTNEEGRLSWEGPQTEVTLTNGFWMGKHEVTQGEYLALMGNNPSWFNGDRTADGGSNYGVNTNRPVETVSWHDATAYCDALTQRERTAGRIGTNCVYQLPTEAEWEYACRGWTSTRFSYGDDPGCTNLTNYAWYNVNSGGTTHPVGQKLPNPWGLYDMHGNVWEWCQDWWGDYPGGIAVDPQGPATGSLRVIRSGFWGILAEGCRSAYRGHDFPVTWLGVIGFRVVLAPGQ